MELKEFVMQALKQVIEGVQNAQEIVPGDGEVNPHIWKAQRGDAAKYKILESNAGKWIHMVEFDIAVTVVESTETKGGIGLVVGPVALGSRGHSRMQRTPPLAG